MPLNEKEIPVNYKTFSSSRRNVTKIILLGDCGVGKTSLIERLINARFQLETPSTVGINLTTKKFSVGSGNPEVLVFTDVSGHKRFADIRKSYYSGIEIVLAVCDITQKESLLNLEKIWVPEFINSNPLEQGLRIKIQFICNKFDLLDKQVITQKDLEETAGRINFLYPEVSILKPSLMASAKENLRVNESFGVPKNVIFS